MAEQVPQQNQITAEQAKIHFLSEQVAEMAKTWANEVADLKIQHMLQMQNLREELTQNAEQEEVDSTEE